MAKQAPTHQATLQRYKTARVNLLTMLLFTVVNIILLFTPVDMMMLFSATVPYYAVAFGIVFEIPWFLIATIIFAVIVLAAYLLCWIFSKKHVGWMIAALVMFALDTVALIGLTLWLREGRNIMDIIFHALVLYYLILGTVNGCRLRKIPEEQIAEEEAALFQANTTPLRRADAEVKHRVLLEAGVAGLQICYRRVMRVNELVVNGYVYDELEMAVETAHTLRANAYGHLICAGYTAGSYSFLQVDGQEIKKKLRLY